MLKSLKRISYRIMDLEKAKQWYSDILGSPPILESPAVAIFLVGDCSLSLVQATDTLPENTDRMEVYWEVDDIDSVYKTLIEKGAQSLTPVMQVLNIRVAKVVDPFGNILGLSGRIPGAEKKNVEEHPSESAMNVAFCRALAAKDEREEIKGPDYLAEIFVREDAKKLLATSETRKIAVQNMVTSPLYGYFIARTAFIDEIFKNACIAEIPQIVFLGAGYDTRPYRFGDIVKTTKIFEADIRPTQQRKLELLKKSGIEIPSFLKYVEVNFKKDKLEDVLTEAGFDNSKKTLFIWEGVMYYLTNEAVDSTFNFIKINSAAGSSLCFDYLNEKLDSINPSEPFLFWISEKDINQFLTDKGFKIKKHMSSPEMSKTYLTLKNGTAAEKILNRFGFVHAETID